MNLNAYFVVKSPYKLNGLNYINSGKMCQYRICGYFAPISWSGNEVHRGINGGRALQFNIRYANASDNHLLAEAGRRLFEAAFGADNRHEDMVSYLSGSFSPEIQAAELADPASVILIAEVEGRFAGYARLREGRPGLEIPGKRPVELVRIYAELDTIGRGAGSALMEACLVEAYQKGYDTVWLGVWEKNPRALRFYEKWGFKVVGTQSFKLGGDIQTDLVMLTRIASDSSVP
jgi:diamine N-acetyltransferase